MDREQELKMIGISTHILDIALGQPARDVPVRLERRDASGVWRLLGAGRTNQDGRCAQLLPEKKRLLQGFIVWVLRPPRILPRANSTPYIR